MAIVRIDNFAGVNLRQDPKKGAFAQAAENVDLDTNSIVPTWGLDYTSRLLLAAATATPRLTIHHLDTGVMLSWTQDVQVALNPLADDSDRRIYYTGEGEPRVTDYSRWVMNAPPYVLGVPQLVSPMMATASGGAGSAQDRAYVVTYVTPWGEEGPPSDPALVTANETGATVELDNIGVSLRSAPLVGVTFFALPAPGYLQFSFVGGYALGGRGLAVGDRVYIRGPAASPSEGEKSYVASDLSGGVLKIAANCWPISGVNQTASRILPFNEYPVSNLTNLTVGATEISMRVIDVHGLRVGEELEVVAPANAFDGKRGTVTAIQKQDSNGDATVTMSWDGTVGFVASCYVRRRARFNTGEVRITNITFAAGIATLTLDDNAEIEVNDRVLIVGVMGAYEINGVRPIAGVSPDGIHVTIAIAALSAYTSGGVLVRPIPYAFDEYGVSGVGGAAGGPYPAAFTVVITLDRDHEIDVGDKVIGYDIGGAIEMNTVLAVSALPATNQITVSMASGHTAFTAGGFIARVERQSKKRIYRTTQGTTDAEYQLVDEIPSDQPYFKDQFDDADLSSTVLEADEWIAPPTDLHHVQAHPHGFLQALTGNVLAQTPGRAPHAWPVSLQKALPVQRAIALGLTGQTAIAVTTEAAYGFTGSDPESMAREKISGSEPCTSATSMAAAGAVGADGSSVQGVAYRGKRGIFLAGPAAAANLTEGLLPASFFASAPRTIAAFWAGKYVWVDNAQATGYILDPRGGDHALTSFRVDYAVTALHVSPVDGQLWAAYSDTTTVPANQYAAPLFKIMGTAPVAGTTPRFDWRSEYRYLPKPVTLAYLLLDFDWGRLSSWMKAREDQLVVNMRARRSGVWNSVGFNQAEFNGGLRRHVYSPDASLITPSEFYVKVTVIANPDSADNQVTVFDDFVSNSTPVKLDDSVKADVWQVRLLGNVGVTAVTLASTMDELRGV